MFWVHLQGVIGLNAFHQHLRGTGELFPANSRCVKVSPGVRFDLFVSLFPSLTLPSSPSPFLRLSLGAGRWTLRWAVVVPWQPHTHARTRGHTRAHARLVRGTRRGDVAMPVCAEPLAAARFAMTRYPRAGRPGRDGAGLGDARELYLPRT